MSTADEEKTPYELLHVGLEATEQEIKKAYRKLSLKVHPDKVGFSRSVSALLRIETFELEPR